MPLANGGVLADKKEPDIDSTDFLNHDQQAFWNALPKAFTTQQAILKAQEHDIPTTTMKRYLNLYCELRNLKRCCRGQYEKI